MKTPRTAVERWVVVLRDPEVDGPIPVDVREGRARGGVHLTGAPPEPIVTGGDAPQAPPAEPPPFRPTLPTRASPAESVSATSGGRAEVADTGIAGRVRLATGVDRRPHAHAVGRSRK